MPIDSTSTAIHRYQLSSFLRINSTCASTLVPEAAASQKGMCASV
jgi:hypothetical protein